MNSYLQAFGIGMVAGSRSMTAPALVTGFLSKQEPRAITNSRLSPFASSAAATMMKAAAAGEMVADKLPGMPARTDTPALLGRLGSGALSGMLVSRAKGSSTVGGALLGALGAAAGTFGFYHLRRLLGEKTPVADQLFGVAEDAIAHVGGSALLDEQ